MGNDRRNGAEKSRLEEVFSFPHPVNEISARLVAGMVFLVTLVITLLDVPSLIPVLAYGFLARVLTGPTLSPMGLLATRVIVPLLGHPNRPVAGPPKRFAQAVGLGFSVTALVLHFGLGLTGASYAVLGVLVLFSGLAQHLQTDLP